MAMNDKFEKNLQRHLHDSEEQLSGEVRSKLHQARTKALEEAKSKKLEVRTILTSQTFGITFLFTIDTRVHYVELNLGSPIRELMMKV